MTDPSEAEALAPPPLVSVVVPTFNYARFLPEALASIVAQDDAGIEVIVVVDGSTDDPAAVLRDFPQVRLIQQGNRGLPAARNVGLKAASGTYIAFVDADDRLLPGAIATWLDLFRMRPESGFVHGSYCSVDAQWQKIWQPHPVNLDDHGFAILLAQGNRIGCPATVMYRRDRLAEIGGFDETLTANDDFDLLLRMLQRFPAASSDRMVAEYRYHDKNMSGDCRRMLTTGRHVVVKHSAACRNDPDLRNAYAAGLAGIQRYWIRAQLRGIKAARGDPPRQRQAVRNSLRLLPLAPVLFVRECTVVAAELLRRGRPSKVDWGQLRRTEPVSRDFGYSRGTPVDRFYIERFLAVNSADVRGEVLEVKDPGYTQRFGGDGVTRSDVLDIDPANAEATILADLNDPSALPSERYDCVIFTQTLQLLYDYRTALRTLVASLKSGGVMLLTVPGITPVAHQALGNTWYWSFTRIAIERLIRDIMPDADVRVEAHGNVLAATALLQGIAVEDVKAQELAIRDPDYPVIITARIVKTVRS